MDCLLGQSLISFFAFILLFFFPLIATSLLSANCDLLIVFLSSYFALQELIVERSGLLCARRLQSAKREKKNNFLKRTASNRRAKPIYGFQRMKPDLLRCRLREAIHQRLIEKTPASLTRARQQLAAHFETKLGEVGFMSPFFPVPLSSDFLLLLYSLSCLDEVRGAAACGAGAAMVLCADGRFWRAASLHQRPPHLHDPLLVVLSQIGKKAKKTKKN